MYLGLIKVGLPETCMCMENKTTYTVHIVLWEEYIQQFKQGLSYSITPFFGTQLVSLELIPPTRLVSNKYLF